MIVGDIVRHTHKSDKIGVIIETSHWPDGDMRDVRVLWGNGNHTVEWAGQLEVINESG